MNRQPYFRLLAFALLALITATANGQSSYSYYSTSEKRTFYIETFSADDPTWESYTSGVRSSRIADGNLSYTSFNDKAHAKYANVGDMDWSKDWEIEVRMRRVNGKETSSNDLIWDRENGNSNKMHFGFTGTGKYNISEYDDGYQRIADFTTASYVNKTSFNTLTVRKVKNKYYFFFNERFIKSHSYSPIKGDYVGFMVPPNSTLEVDHIKVFYLEKGNTNNYTSTTSSSGNGSYDTFGASKKTVVYREDFSSANSDWEVYRSGQRMGKIQGGNLDWVSMNNSAQMIWHTLDDMSWSRDWQIEIRMKHLRGKPNSSNDLLWNISESGTDKYHFGFTAEGKYVFSKKVGSDYNSIVPFTASSIVNKSDFNKVTVRKVDNSYYYFFNEKLITTKSYHTVSSDKVGFMVPPNSTLQVDYLEVAYLNNSSTTYTSVTAPPSSGGDSGGNNPSSSVTNVKEALVGTWYGGATGDDEKGYFKFFNSGTIQMITANDTIGGPNYVESGIKIDLTYDVNQSSNPQHLDLIFSSSGQEFGRMKGIIRFKDRNTFELKLGSELTSPRPTAFTNTTDNKVAIFTRTN